MLIDAHVHPAFIEELNLGEEKYRRNAQEMGLYKTEAFGLRQWDADMAESGIDKLFLLPLALPESRGGALVTNCQIADLVRLRPGKFVGFASVDPHSAAAAEELEYAFAQLGLKGLKLHPSKQHFSPSDELLTPLYEICLRYDKPIIFHAGVSMEPGTLTKHSHPLEFEEVAFRYPKLRMCLAHFGWPWVREVCMLMLKYPNVYTDTAMLYFDDPRQFYHQCLEVDIGPGWIDRSLRHH